MAATWSRSPACGALVVDYVLTITTSIAAGTSQPTRDELKSLTIEFE